MPATKAALASGGITHCCLRCGLRMFFLASAPIVLSLAFSTMLSSTTFSSSRRRLPRAKPSGAGESVSAISFASAAPVENPRPGGVGIVFSLQHRRKPFLDQLAPGALDRGDAGLQ